MRSTVKVNHAILINSGYKFYDYQDKGKALYQKRVMDKDGTHTKYFINVYHYFEFEMWTFDIQLNPGSYDTINIETVQWFNGDQKYSRMTVEDVESLFEKLFTVLECKNYD